MNQQTYGYQAITAYLLGALPAEESERFDELSFTDDAFAAQLQAAEKDLVDAYVNGELTGSQLDQFNSHYLASPLRREKIEFARALQIVAKPDYFTETAEPQKDVAPADDEKPDRTISGLLSNLFAIPNLSLKWGFAAVSLIFAIFAGWLLFENSLLPNQVDNAQEQGSELQPHTSEPLNEVANQRMANAEKEKELAPVSDGNNLYGEEPRSDRLPTDESDHGGRRIDEQKQPQQPSVPKKEPPKPSQVTIASFVLTPQLRSSGQIQTLPIPAKTGWVDLRLELEPTDQSVFRAALANQPGGRVIWHSGAVKAKGAGENRSLNLRLPARLLKSDQTYTLEVSGNGEIFSNYSFRAVVK